MTKNNGKNIIKFELIDGTNMNEYNQTCEMKKVWYTTDDDEVLTIENYYEFCKEFAAALGFCEKTIEEWFGSY